MSAAHVDALLASCDRSTTSGRRDYAVLALLARLGLRSGEVAALQLGDVDWRAGEVAVRGKARRQDRLPLPVEVGEALAAYLRRGQTAQRMPTGDSDPLRTISADPSQLDHQHRLSRVSAGRHAAGGRAPITSRAGDRDAASGWNLMEIAQVLRQSDPGTTSGYAKVDRVALRAVAQSWPGVAR